MDSRKIRRVIVIIIFILSFAVLLWSIWPIEESTQVLPISPNDMQLPTPDSFVPLLSSLWIA